MIQVIIPAAGESKRFSRKGIKLPKPLIKFSWGDFPKKTMLEHALHGLGDQTVHIGTLVKLAQDFKEAFPPPKFFVHQLSESLGQANTVKQVVDKLAFDSPILILNSDSMFLYPLGAFLVQVNGFDGAAIVFDGKYNPAYSYVDKYPLFDSAIEKDPISPWAMAGAFYFKSKTDFINAYEAYHATSPKEEHLSEVYNFLPGNKLAVFVPKEQWIVWGTAEELLSDDNVNDIEF